MLWLDQTDASLPIKLTQLVESAMAANEGLQQRAAMLGDAVRARTTALLLQAPELARAA